MDKARFLRGTRSWDRATFARQVRDRRRGIHPDRNRNDYEDWERSALRFSEIATEHFGLRRADSAAPAGGWQFSTKTPGYKTAMASISRAVRRLKRRRLVSVTRIPIRRRRAWPVWMSPKAFGAMVHLTWEGSEFLRLRGLAESLNYLRQYSEDELYSIASETFSGSSDTERRQMVREIKQKPRGRRTRP
jgi:hypothetical protein